MSTLSARPVEVFTDRRAAMLAFIAEYQRINGYPPAAHTPPSTATAHPSPPSSSWSRGSVSCDPR